MLKTTFEKRINALQDYLSENKIDLALLTDRENLIYFTGLTQIECMALIVPANAEPTAISLWLDVDYIKEKWTVGNVQGYRLPVASIGNTVADVIKGLKLTNPTVGCSRYFIDFAVFEALQKEISGIQFTGVADQLYRIRAVKEPYEIELIQKASCSVVKGMERAVKAISVGVKEVEILAEAEYAMRKAGSEGSNFRMQVLTGKRQLLTHAHATNNPIKDRQTVVIHLGATYKGYCAKLCRTVAVGNVPMETKRVYDLLLAAQQRAAKALKPGEMVKNVYKAAYTVIEEAGYGKYFIDDIGHGIGIRQSEFYPVIGRNRTHVLEENMVVDLMFPTIYHKQHGGARVTDLLQVTADGSKFLTDFPRELMEV